jgi:hypothetical protein
LTDRFEVHAVAEDDSKRVVDAKELIVHMGDGKALRISLRNHDMRGELTLLSDHESIILRPGACNLLRISLEHLQGIMR